VKTKTKITKKIVKSNIMGRVKHSLKMAIVPHKKNGYRPHLVRGYGLVAIAFIVIGLQLGYNGAKTGNVLGRESNITVESLLANTNQERVKAGEPQLNLDNKLVKAAYLKAQDMFDRQYWAHNAPDGTEPWKWFGDVGYNYDMAGENLAKNFTSTSSVMTAWMNSPEHKSNVLKGDYQDVGFAIVSGDMDGQPTSIVVAMYGLSAQSATANIQKAVASAVTTERANILTQFAISIQSATPAVMGGLALLMLGMFVSILAHAHRNKLPKILRQSWYRHHGLYKAVGLMSFSLVIIFLYGGGQI